MNAVVETRTNPLVEIKHQIDAREAEFEAALPAHIPVERYKRVLLTAVQNNPRLMKVERRSFFNAAMRAAQDGLLPDGREGAIVEYDDRTRGLIAQWMPMIAGLRKKVRNSGEIADWNAYVVHENDEFEYQLGDDPFIRHKPALDNPGKPIAVYSVAKFKSGEVSREVMSIAEVEKVRAVSRAKDVERGPWKQWFEEMARKTVARRHSKVLPMSTDLDDLLRRDDELYDLEGAREESRHEARRPKLGAMLDQIAQVPRDPAEATEAAGDDAGASTNEPGAPASDRDDADMADDRAFLRGDSGELGEPAEAADSERDRLLSAARSKAMEGAKKLRLWRARLPPEQAALLGDADWRALEDAAVLADQEPTNR